MSMPEVTTHFVRLALAGDDHALTWIVTRFEPLVRAHVRSHMSAPLQERHAEDDIVQEVWIRALPKLDRVQAKGGRMTPVLLRFLGSTVLYTCLEFHRRSVRSEGFLGEEDAHLHISTKGAMTAAIEREACRTLEREIEKLAVDDRSLLLMILMEGVSMGRAASTLDINKSTVSRRFGSIIRRLRNRLPGSLFDDLDLTESEQD